MADLFFRRDAVVEALMRRCRARWTAPLLTDEPITGIGALVELEGSIVHCVQKKENTMAKKAKKASEQIALIKAEELRALWREGG